jgi:hypothetical protein
MSNDECLNNDEARMTNWNLRPPRGRDHFVIRHSGFLGHSSLVIRHSRIRAGDGNRTHDNDVGNVVLCQLSYARNRTLLDCSALAGPFDMFGT